MLFRKKFFSNVLVISISSLPFLADAGNYASTDLTIVNNTKNYSTSVINNGPCSTILGDIGVTKPNSTSIVPSDEVKFACTLNESNCAADVYMTNNCSGPKIATVIFDTDAGIKSVHM
ncbi:MAG: hypothetical protein JO149_02955, partial [Gammaproteobacteria bacterium]|nr:hypothetical protein [Gammaproteobacteria bacterium]